MNTFQNSQERRSIRVKEFLDDFHAGVMDEELLAKYRLTPAGLEKFYSMLQERGILTLEEIAARYETQEEEPEEDSGLLETSSYICPSCLSSHKTMFDICPECGVSFQDMITAEDQPGRSQWQSDPDELLGPDRTARVEGGFDRDRELDPIEIPEHPLVSRDFPDRLTDENIGSHVSLTSDAPLNALDEVFGQSAPTKGLVAKQGIPGEGVGFHDDLLDDLNAGKTFGDDDEESHVGGQEIPVARCDNCQDELLPALRDVYDHKRGRLALLLSGVSLVLVLLGAAALGFFDGYSLGRLFVVYLTGMFLLSGAILGTVGAFMHLAREKVYYCATCKRVYPRG